MSETEQREMSRIQPCAVCSTPLQTPTGTEAEYALVLPTHPQAWPCYVVCGECADRLTGRAESGGKVANPGGVRDALRERYGVQACSWTSPKALGPLLDEAAAYLASDEAQDGMDFGSWQKMQDLLRWS